MFRSILVPLDGSAFAEQALPWAQSIANKAGATLQLVHVHKPMEPEVPEHQFLSEDWWTTELKTRQRDYLDGITSRLGAAGVKLAEPLIHQGDVAESIHRIVVEKKIDLVVMTTHGRGPAVRMWLGSVADRLIRVLPIPLLLIRPGESTAGFDSERVIRHVLVPLDGTKLAEGIIQPALTFGECMDADYTLMRVINPVLTTHDPLPDVAAGTLLRGGFPQQPPALGTERRRKALEYLDEVAERLRERLERVRTEVVEDEHPAVAIVETAKRISADLIAMQTHGRHGVARALLGSVADKVLRSATIPLLVERPG
ncbi:MAG TPA: universal stress protein [Gemmataceae bacterium]|nr:universal stress protein [Gemmataceae bacterium]